MLAQEEWLMQGEWSTQGKVVKKGRVASWSTKALITAQKFVTYTDCRGSETTWKFKMGMVTAGRVINAGV